MTSRLLINVFVLRFRSLYIPVFLAGFINIFFMFIPTYHRRRNRNITSEGGGGAETYIWILVQHRAMQLGSRIDHLLF